MTILNKGMRLKIFIENSYAKMTVSYIAINFYS